MKACLLTPSSALRWSLAGFCCGIAASAVAGTPALAVALCACVIANALRPRSRYACAALGFLAGAVRTSLSTPQAATSIPATGELAKFAARILPSPESDLAASFLIGGSTGLPPALVNDFRHAGISHLLAASGYNVSLLTSLTCTGLCVIGIRRPTAAAYTVCAIAFFVLASGGQSSVIRAAFMGSLALVASVVGRRYDPVNALLFAASLMLAIDPTILIRDVGFQLSFSAVWGLHALAPALEPRLVFVTERFGLRRIVAETSAATLATLPVSLAVFGNFPVFAVFANMLALPAVPAATAVGLAALAVSVISAPVALPLAFTAYALLRYIEGVAAFFGGRAALVIRVPAGPVAASALAACILLLWYALRRAPSVMLDRPSSGVLIEE